MNKLFFIQHVDRKTPLDEIARLKNISLGVLMKDLEHIIYSGTKLNLDYYIKYVVDQDKIDDRLNIADVVIEDEYRALKVIAESLGSNNLKRISEHLELAVTALA